MIIITNNEVEVLLNELEIICIEYNKVKKSVMAVLKNREGHSWENVSMVRYTNGKVADLIFEGDSVKKLRQEIKDEKEIEKQKHEWSEEDEEIRTALIKYLGSSDALSVDLASAIYWLKSIRPQSTWKPSIEQLDALYDVLNPSDGVDKKALESLYKQLKAL